MIKKLILILTISLIAAAISCNKKNNAQNANSQSAITVNVGNAQTPTEAYTMLYTAVKAKEPAAIKKMLSKKTIGLAEGAAGQQKKSVEQVVENGFTSTTFAATMPQMRDERVKENMGALEVWNERDKKWEDLPFVREDDEWKLAVGDIFAGTYQSPGKGQSRIESEASNTNKMIPYGNGNFKDMPPTNGNPNSNVNVVPMPRNARKNKR